VGAAIAAWVLTGDFLGAAAVVSGRTLRLYLGAALLGSLGALISVLTRYSSMGVDHFPGRSLSMLGGAARIALGALFGPVAVLAAQAGLLLTLVLEKPGGPYLIAILAGFSERIVPDLLHKLDDEA